MGAALLRKGLGRDIAGGSNADGLHLSAVNAALRHIDGVTLPIAAADGKVHDGLHMGVGGILLIQMDFCANGLACFLAAQRCFLTWLVYLHAGHTGVHSLAVAEALGAGVDALGVLHRVGDHALALFVDEHGLQRDGIVTNGVFGLNGSVVDLENPTTLLESYNDLAADIAVVVEEG